MNGGYVFEPCPACEVEVERVDSASLAAAAQATSALVGGWGLLKPCGHPVEGCWMEDGVLHWILPGGMQRKQAELAVRELARIAEALA